MPYIHPQKADEPYDEYLNSITDRTIIEEAVLDIIEATYHKPYGYVVAPTGSREIATATELNSTLCRLLL